MLIHGRVQAINERSIWLQNGRGSVPGDERHAISIAKITLGKAQQEGTRDMGLPKGMSIGDLLGKSISVICIPREYSFLSTNMKNKGQPISGTTYYVSKIQSIA